MSTMDIGSPRVWLQVVNIDTLEVRYKVDISEWTPIESGKFRNELHEIMDKRKFFTRIESGFA